MTPDDPRAELAQIAASLRAYLEWQQDSGTIGIPRGPRPADTASRAPERREPATSEREGAREAAREPAPPAPPVHAVPVAREPQRDAPVAAAPVSYEPQWSAPPVLPVFHEQPPPAPAAPITSAAPARPSGNGDVAQGLVRLEQMRQEVATCTQCGLAPTRTNTVFSRGNPQAKLCFVGEAPGADEDAQGLPFVGRAGQLLDKMIGAMGLSPEQDVYVCNIIKCRPPGNRRPTPEETNTCIPYLHEQLAIIRPRVIVALGNTAVASLLQTTMGITKIRGQWKLYRGATLVMPTYHPSYLLRPSATLQQAKREAWEDLQMVMKELGIELPKKR